MIPAATGCFDRIGPALLRHQDLAQLRREPSLCLGALTDRLLLDGPLEGNLRLFGTALVREAVALIGLVPDPIEVGTTLR